MLLVVMLGTVEAAGQPVAPKNLSTDSILGYFPYKNPRPASWYLSKFSSNFSAFIYEDVSVDNVSGVRLVDSLAARYPKVTFYVELVIPPQVDLYNGSALSQVESELRACLLAINESNVKGVLLGAMAYGQWGVLWVRHPPKAELTSWYSWLQSRGFQRLVFAQNGTVYTPLFAEWAVQSAAQIAAELINYSRGVRPDLAYGIVQYDSVAEDLDTVQSLYTFYQEVRPNFTLTQDLALARPVQGYTSYPYAYVILTAPMSPSYEQSVGELWVDDSFAAITSSSRDTSGMALFKFELNEVSTYMSGATPLVNAFFVGPDGNFVPLQEFVLDPALQINDLPLPTTSISHVLVIRPTFSIGNRNQTAAYQQELFYSLIKMGIPFDYVSEAFVYAHPHVVDRYKYVFYASNEITPQMNYILSSDNSSVKVGLSSTYIGYFYAPEPSSYRLPFNVYVANFTEQPLHFLGKPLPDSDHEIFYGSNEISWNSSGLYVNGKPISVRNVDYLGLTSGWTMFLSIGAVLAAVGLGLLAYSIYRNRSKERRLREILRESQEGLP
ncbi:hypothetical protein [Tardisphaera saccharovorans]